jgi:hypothetical protein
MSETEEERPLTTYEKPAEETPYEPGEEAPPFEEKPLEQEGEGD